MPLNIADILQNCRLFAEVPPASFRRLATMGQICRFRKGQQVFREGEECPGVFVVGTGRVRVFKRGPGGKEHVLHMVGPGDTFAEVAAMGGFPCPASAEAMTATSCALLPQGPFRRALHEDHQLCLGMMTGMTQWVRHLVGLMEDVVLRDASGRVARFLLEARPAADGLIELPGLKRYVASHLNLTSETFSRTLRRMIHAGLVAESGANRLRIVNARGLRLVAEGMFPKL